MVTAVKNSEKPQKKWPKRLLWFFAILLLLLWALNGPIARWALHSALNQSLDKIGLHGDTKVSGTLLRGFSLNDLSYQGTQGIKTLKASEIGTEYRLLKELTKGKVRTIALNNAEIVIDLDGFPPSKKEKKPNQLKTTLATVRKWLTPPSIDLQDLDVTLLRSEKRLAHFTLESLKNSTDADIYQLTGFQATDIENRQTPKQNVTLEWHENSLSIQHLEVLPDIALDATSLDWNQQLKAHADLQLLTATLAVDIDQTISAELTSGTLDSTSLSKRFDLQLPAAFSIKQLNATINNWQSPIPDWDIELNMQLPTASYNNYQLQDSQLTLTQKDNLYQADLTTSFSNAPLTLSLKGKWLQPDAQQWWDDTDFDYAINCSKLAQLPELFSKFPKGLTLSNSQLSAKGSASIIQRALKSITTNGTLTGARAHKTALPQLQVSADYQHLLRAQLEFTTQHHSKTPFQGKLHYTFENDHYEAELSLKEKQPHWINSLLSALKVDTQLNNAVDLSWKGSGTSDIQLDQQGEFNVRKLSISTSKNSKIDLSTNAKYRWPDFVEVPHFTISDGLYHANSTLAWDGNLLTITQGELLREQESIAKVSAKIPYHTEITSLEAFLKQTQAWSIDLNSKPIAIQQLNNWFNLTKVEQLRDLEGSASIDLHITGSPHAPDISGSTQLENLRGIANQDLDALHMRGKFASQNKKLRFQGELLEAKDQRATLQLETTFTPLEWIQQKEDLNTLLKETRLAGVLDINTLPLNRVARFIPQLKEVTGHLSGRADIAGNLLDPKINLDTKASIPKLVIAGNEVDSISNIEIACTANDQRLVKATLSATINGGEFKSNADIDLTDIQNPKFSIKLNTNHAMVFRNDSISMRANADLTLDGNLEDATLSGDIDVVESLFYKDIDILPIGVPSSEVAEVDLPALNPNVTQFSVPAPFNKWKLNVQVALKDPLLIRGNIADGQITGRVKVTGTVEAPALDGTIIADKVVARLPFSRLNIHKGRIHFSPKNGLIPTLDIQGKSTVNSYDTNIFVYGSAAAPKTTFSSYPPLPESDILTLLATGVTASGLNNNKEAATLRAFQLFLIKLKQESGNTRKAKALAKVLAGMENLEFNVNEVDGFTARKFSSAKIKLNEHFYFTGRIDENQQTRGLIVYILRFK